MQSRLLKKFFSCIVAAAIVILIALVSGKTAEQSSQAQELNIFIDEIQRASEQVSSFTSDFVQEKHLALFSEPVVFSGRITVARPDRLRWEFVSPIASLLILNGNIGIRCKEAGKPVQFNLQSDPVMRGAAEQLWLWFSGDYEKLKSLYSLQKTGENTLAVKPLTSSVSQVIGAVTIQFDGATKQPEVVEIDETGGDYTRIIFTSYQRNPALPDALFQKCAIDE